MSSRGWIFLFASWGLVSLLVVFCFYRLFMKR